MSGQHVDEIVCTNDASHRSSSAAQFAMSSVRLFVWARAKTCADVCRAMCIDVHTDMSRCI